MTFEVRLLRSADAYVLDRVAPDLFDDPVQPELLREFLEDPRHHLVVAIDAMDVVGFISAVSYVHPDKDTELWINEVGVASTHWRRGIGSQMLSEMLKHARSIGCGEAWVLTDGDNVAANKLYASLGGDAKPQVMYTFKLNPPQS